MYDEANTWAVVLAAGDGTRLQSLTTGACGKTVPKQFCSLYEGPSLLQEALSRAEAVACTSRTCAVVAQQHRQWWVGELDSLPDANVIVQPENRGTANGILLPVLHILERQPDAQIVLLPSDHHVQQESILAASMRKAVEQLRWRFDEAVLMGLQPEEIDPELGYIVPGRSDGKGALTVTRFVEKPPFTRASELIERGALWNAFIVVASARALLAMFKESIPQVVCRMSAAVKHDLDAGTGTSATAELYADLPAIDFSKDILPGQEAHLRVLPVPRCGWSDLGTPKRVAEALCRTSRPAVVKQFHTVFGGLSLAAQHDLLMARSALQPGA
jgi:mannose-1-phosphate guanylyltransferase